MREVEPKYRISSDEGSSAMAQSDWKPAATTIAAATNRSSSRLKTILYLAECLRAFWELRAAVLPAAAVSFRLASGHRRKTRAKPEVAVSPRRAQRPRWETREDSAAARQPGLASVLTAGSAASATRRLRRAARAILPKATSRRA